MPVLQEKAGRRRGDALEDAILDAAWSELAEHGYAGFTLDAAAKRAGTSRPVLYRRWSNRSDLAAAAIKHQIIKVQIVVPDLGNLREELVLLLQKLSDRGVPTLMTLLLDMSDFFVEGNSSYAELKEELASIGSIDEIIRRAVARGEIDPARLTPRIIALPIDLVRSEVILTLRPAPPDVIAEIVDDIFLPLVVKQT